MTLQEMSHQYRDDARVFAARIRLLEQQKTREPDAEAQRRLQRRIVELQPLLRQSRALAEVTGRYYDRRYHGHALYRL